MEEIIPEIRREGTSLLTERVTSEIWTADGLKDIDLPLCSIRAVKKYTHLWYASSFPFVTNSSHFNSKQSENSTWSSCFGFFFLMLLGHSKGLVSLIIPIKKENKNYHRNGIAPIFQHVKIHFKQSCFHLCSKHQQTGPTASQANLDSAELAEEAKFIWVSSTLYTQGLLKSLLQIPWKKWNGHISQAYVAAGVLALSDTYMSCKTS